MKKTILLSILLTALMLGCGEAGFQSDVSKETEIVVVLDESIFEDLGPNFFYAEFSETVDPTSDDFGSYVDDIENYFVNEIKLEIGTENLNQTLGLDDFAITINSDFLIDSDNAVIDALTDDDGKLRAQGNPKQFVLYNREDNSKGLVGNDNPAVQAILDALSSSRPLVAGFFMTVSGEEVSGSIDITVYLDLTGRLDLN
jgi:hypothetical protein